MYDFCYIDIEVWLVKIVIVFFKNIFCGSIFLESIYSSVEIDYFFSFCKFVNLFVEFF